MLLVVLASISLIFTGQVNGENESSRFSLVGCYNDKLDIRTLRNMYLNQRKTGINWKDLSEVVDNCAKKALENNIAMFGIQFWGECRTDDDAANRYDMYGEVSPIKFKKKCYEFYSATKNRTLGLGKGLTNYIYKLTGPCDGSPPPCGCGTCIKVSETFKICLCPSGSINQIPMDFSSPCIDVDECPDIDCGDTGECRNKQCSGYECHCVKGEHVDKNDPKSKCSVCGIKPALPQSIVGGEDALPGDWPWMVSVLYQYNNNKHWCGGVVLSEDWVLTAAHCFVYSESKAHYTLVLGEHNLGANEGEQRLSAEKIILHPRYDEITTDYDVALIKLKTKAVLNDKVKPLCLIGDDMNFPAGTECYVTGWGYLNEGGPVSNILQYAKVPLISQSTCKAAMKPYTITNRMFCAGYAGGGIDSCSGDSGGPLACQKDGVWYLVGDVSWGVGCARKDVYGVYGNIKVMKPWIVQTIASN